MIILAHLECYVIISCLACVNAQLTCGSSQCVKQLGPTKHFRSEYCITMPLCYNVPK